MTKVSHNIYAVDGLEILFPGHGVIPYIIEEGQNDLTLIDTCYIRELPKLEAYLNNIGYKMTDIKRIILTHAHADHAQAANEIKMRTSISLDGQAKIYSHWIDSAFLAHSPPYHGPPTLSNYKELLQKNGLTIEDTIKKFGKLDVDPIFVDGQLDDGDMIKSLKVIHTPGHTPGHISLYSEEQGILFGADILWNRKASGGLVIPPSYFTLDQVTAAVSVMRVSQLSFDKLLLGHQDNPILENAQSVVQDAAKSIIHRLKQSQNG